METIGITQKWLRVICIYSTTNTQQLLPPVRPNQIFQHSLTVNRGSPSTLLELSLEVEEHRFSRSQSI